jgi:hypothetical protein
VPRTRTRERDSAQVRRVGRTGQMAVVFAVLGGIVVVVNEILSYRSSGAVDWGRVALAFGVPLLIYVIVRSASRR